MTYNPASSRLRGKKVTSSHGGCPRGLRYHLRMTFVSGPKVLMTSRISTKCAVVMMLMCSPSLIFCSLLTVPQLIFQSPQQQAYYQFSSVLNEDPSRWAVLFLAAVCTLMSLAMPATMSEPNTPIRY